MNKEIMASKKFSEVKSGVVFRYNQVKYLKIEEGSLKPEWVGMDNANAIKLENGRVMSFDSDMMVIVA